MSDICLVNMPFATLELPSLALGLLKSILVRGGLDTGISCENLRYAELIGLSGYHLFTKLRVEVLTGEWIFADAAFPGADLDPDAYLDAVFQPHVAHMYEDFGFRVDDARKLAEAARACTSEYIDACVDRILAHSPRLVGCTSTFQQQTPSLAVLRRLRERAPQIVTMLGGANCETTMGVAIHRACEWVDIVVSGEADSTIVELCTTLLERGASVEAAALPHGVFAPIHRDEGYPTTSHGDGRPRATTRELVDLPVPDYDDYFTTLEANRYADKIHPGLAIETSRGCWWGERSHCTFCGLNGAGMSYRSKPPDDVLNEIEQLSTRHTLRKFEATDNILNMKFFDTLLPALAERDEGYGFFFEIKANLSRAQVELLRRAGVRWVQPGIESLSTPVLRLMGKGATAITNLQLLKWCRENGIATTWSVLYGFPHEKLEWYEPQADLLPLIHHLHPPLGSTPVRVDRYSPYHQRASEYGLILTPSRAYRHIYPLASGQLRDVAYYFEASGVPSYGRHQNGERPLVLQRLFDRIADWKRAFAAASPPTLVMVDLGTRTVVEDRRACATAPRHVLDGLHRDVHALCDRGLSLKSLASELAIDEDDHALSSVVSDLIATKLVARVDHRYLALALRDTPPLPLPEEFPGGWIQLDRNSQPRTRPPREAENR